MPAHFHSFGSSHFAAMTAMLAAAVALIAASRTADNPSFDKAIRPSQKTFELAYFWALAGTIQGLVTPDVNYSFPEPQFVVFFMGHAAIIAAAIYLTLGTRMRQVPASLPRVMGWTLAYAVSASLADWALGTNYGFFRAKPNHASFFDLMAAWPYYIPETVLLGVVAALVLYLPFLLADRISKARTS